MPAGLDPEVAAELLCAITHEPMDDPVVAADTYTYERAAIEGKQGAARRRLWVQKTLRFLSGACLQLLLGAAHAPRLQQAACTAGAVGGMHRMQEPCIHPDAPPSDVCLPAALMLP